MRDVGVRVTAVVGVAMLLAGCGAAEEVLPTGADGDVRTPLSDYLDAIIGDTSTEAQIARTRLVEELTASCMADQGFTYLPVDPVESGAVLETPDLGMDWDGREFAETYGYGLSTDPWGLRERAEQETPADPNDALTAAMSAAERTAYYDALYGTQSLDDEPEYDPQQAGCQGAAQHEAGGQESAWEDEEYDWLREELYALDRAVYTSQRVAEATAAWAACMAEAGYPGLADVIDAQVQVSDTMNAATARVVFPEATEAPEFEAAKAELRALYDDVAAQEIAIAVTDYDCQEQAGYDEAVLRSRMDLEQAFVEKNAAELDAWAAAGAAR